MALEQLLQAHSISSRDVNSYIAQSPSGTLPFNLNEHSANSLIHGLLSMVVSNSKGDPSNKKRKYKKIPSPTYYSPDVLHQVLSTTEALRLMAGVAEDVEKLNSTRAPQSRIYQERAREKKLENFVQEYLDIAPNSMFKSLVAMDKPDFLHLVTLLEKRNAAGVANGLCQREKLFLTLSWLRSGVSFTYHGAVFKVSNDTVRRIIRETLSDLKSILSTGDYDCRPKNKKDWVDVAQKFEKVWGMPHCLGAIDGKHCRVVKFDKHGRILWNYKGFNSVILLAVVDADYRFIHICVGAPGARSDGGVFGEDTFGKEILNGVAEDWLPPDDFLSDDAKVQRLFKKQPYFFLGDAAFPLTRRILTPFGDLKLTNSEYNYNFIHAGNRMVVEGSFGQIASQFHIFGGLRTKKKMTHLAITTACHIHNYLKKRHPQTPNRRRDHIFENLPSAMPSLSTDDIPDLDNSAPQDSAPCHSATTKSAPDISAPQDSVPIPQGPCERLKEGQAVRNNLRQFFAITGYRHSSQYEYEDVIRSNSADQDSDDNSD